MVHYRLKLKNLSVNSLHAILKEQNNNFITTMQNMNCNHGHKFYQIFLSPQVKRGMIVSNKYGI